MKFKEGEFSDHFTAIAVVVAQAPLSSLLVQRRIKFCWLRKLNWGLVRGQDTTVAHK